MFDWVFSMDDMNEFDEDEVYVYFLIDPRTNIVRYVGLSRNPENRFNGHRSTATNKLVRQWVSELKRQGLRPIEKIVRKCAGYGEGTKWERRWISRLAKRHGKLLLNIFDRINRRDQKRIKSVRREAVHLKMLYDRKVNELARLICECGGMIEEAHLYPKRLPRTTTIVRTVKPA